MIEQPVSERNIERVEGEENVAQEDVEEKDDADTAEDTTPMSFADWFEQSDFYDQPLVLENVHAMTTEDIIQHYADEWSVEEDWYAVAYTNLLTGETYTHNEDEHFLAASTTKTLHAMTYMELIDKGDIKKNHPIPYAPHHYQQGGGDITAAIEMGQPEEYYPLDYVMAELIAHSDNSAWLMLIDYYNLNHGDIYEAMHELLNPTFYPVELLRTNETTAAYLEQILLTLLEYEMYEPILEAMRQADEDLFLLNYLDNRHPVKYGHLDENNHHKGIYEINQKPVSTFVILTRYLNYDEANEFIGGIALQMAVKDEYDHYLQTFTE